VKAAANPIAPFLLEGGVLVLDGGLATELERAGFDLAHPLWSARLLRDEPGAIRLVHRDYLEAGADCITSASYQATVPGFVREGLSASEAESLIQRSVELALEARDEFWVEPRNREGRKRPLVAASVGPYGAYLANGAEYTGDYDRDEGGLVEFHRDRLHLLARSGADLLACETIPSGPEARALATLLRASPGIPAWVSFSCRVEARLRDGTPLVDCVRLFETVPRLVAVGVNCTSPDFIEALVATAATATRRPLVAYPNSGETYDAATKTWAGSPASDWGARGRAWRRAGARLIGGCCRTGPAHVRALAMGVRS
jgi:homocysteine S-methyltransferase